MDPMALVITWLEECVAGSDPRPLVTALLDTSRDLPQLEVNYIAQGIPTRADGRLDAVWVTLDVGIVAWAWTAPRFPWADAWAAINPVLDAARDLSAGAAWTSPDGHRIENVTNLVVTQGVDPDAKQATVTATCRLRVRLA